MTYASLNDGSTANGVFVASRTPFHPATKSPPGASPGVLLLASFQEWKLLAAYFPQLGAKRRFFKVCAELAMVHAKLPFAIIGDFNTGNQLLDKSATGSPYACADHFDALTKEAGLTDLWRHTNGMAARDWTWLSHRNNGFRIDHAFGNDPLLRLLQPSCVHDHGPRKMKLTDHSALVLTCA